MNLALGPVVGQTGGGVEIVEQQIVESGTVTLPDGWGSAWVIAQARADTGRDLRNGHLFGWSIPLYGASYHRVGLLKPGSTLSVQVESVYNTDVALVDITMIRID